MEGRLKLKLHKIKCIEKQEADSDEIILWGIIVTSNNLFMVTPEIPERSFKTGSVKNFDPALDLITIPLYPQDIQTKVVMGRAAVWIIERDGETFNKDEAYNMFSKLYVNKSKEIKNSNPNNDYYGLQAFREVLPVFHQRLKAAAQTHIHPSIDWWGNLITDNDEIFPYIYTDFSSNQQPPITHEDSSPIFSNVKSAYGGKYQVNLSWSFELVP